jgi:hypothetical protein
MPPVIVQDKNGNTRVTLGDISVAQDDSDFGLKVVASDGTTVIIDGTSDVFKITATGTTSLTVPANSSATTSVSLPGLGTVTLAPAHACYIGDTSGAGANKFLGNYSNTSLGWIAATSGGATTTQSTVSALHARAGCTVVSSTVTVNILGVNATGASQDFFVRYYTLLETGM